MDIALDGVNTLTNSLQSVNKSNPSAYQKEVQTIIRVIEYGLDQFIQTYGLNKLELKNTTVQAEFGQDSAIVNGKSEFSRKDQYKVQPLTSEQGKAQLVLIQKFFEPLTNISSLVTQTEGNVIMKKIQDCVRQVAASIALTLNSGESYTMNGNSMKVTIVKYDTDTRPKGNITQSTKSTPTN